MAEIIGYSSNEKMAIGGGNGVWRSAAYLA
jgi:hypothetical protein